MFRRFSSIEPFANVVKQVRMRAKHAGVPLPKITYEVVTKIHGTNSAICYDHETGELFAQSRERILSYEADNAGFYTWVMSNKEKWINAFKSTTLIPPKVTYLYGGEWFGGNIQKGVAVSQLAEKHFGAFEMVDVEHDGKETFYRNGHIDLILTEADVRNTCRVSNIVPSTYIEIDYNDPAAVQNTLFEFVQSAENECPVGKFFGVSGIGEGVVLTATNADPVFVDMPKIKCKGEKHSVTKVHTIRELTDAEIASKKNAAEFVDYALTENRLEQGWSKLEEMGLPQDITSLGAFLKWVVQDVIRECHDVLCASMLTSKDVSGSISQKSKTWYINKLQETSIK